MTEHTEETDNTDNANPEQKDTGARMKPNTDMERVDNDPNAKTDDTRIRIETGEHDTYVLKRERYCLVKHESAFERDNSDKGYEEYDWATDETFILHGDNEAKQFAAGIADAGAFDPNVLFFRQREFTDDTTDKNDPK